MLRALPQALTLYRTYRVSVWYDVSDCVVRQAPCPPGTWSNATGLSAPCTQLCAAGYICVAGSTTPAPVPCGSPAVYCVQGVWEAAPVPSGFYSWGGLDNGTTRVGISPCPAPSSNGGVGVYCPTGSGSMVPCDAGYYGNASQLSVSTCSGPCAAGYFCPLGSSSPTMSACGSAAVYVGFWNFRLEECGLYLWQISATPPVRPMPFVSAVVACAMMTVILCRLHVAQSGTAPLVVQHLLQCPTGTSRSPSRTMLSFARMPFSVHLAVTARLVCGTCARQVG
jgi:hypothetical protein